MALSDAFLYLHPTRLFTATLISVQMKGVDVVHIWSKFYSHVTCNSGVLIFEKFSLQQKVPFQAASGWFFVSNPPPPPRSFVNLVN